MDKDNKKKLSIKPFNNGVSKPRIVGSIVMVIVSEIILISYLEFGLLTLFQGKNLPMPLARNLLFSTYIIIYAGAGIIYGFFMEKSLSIHVTMGGTVLFTILRMFTSVPIYARTNFYIIEYLIIPVFYFLGLYVFRRYRTFFIPESTPEKLVKIRKYSYYGMSFLVFFNLALVVMFQVQMRRLPGYENMKHFQLPVYEGAQNVKERFNRIQCFRELWFQTNQEYPSTEIIEFYDSKLKTKGFIVVNPKDGWNNSAKGESSSRIFHRFLRIYKNNNEKITVVVDVFDLQNPVELPDEKGNPRGLQVVVSVHPVIPGISVSISGTDVNNQQDLEAVNDVPSHEEKSGT